MTSDAPSARGPGRPRQFDRDAVIGRAVTVFRERGFHGASVDVLSQGTGLSAGSLYKAFADKKALFAAAFDRYLADRQASLADRLASEATGRARLAAVIDLYLEAASGAEGRRGCLVVAGLVEAAVLDEAQRAAVAAALDTNEARILALLSQGQDDGSIRADLDKTQAASVLLALLQGIRVLGKLREPAGRAAFVAMALKILD